MECAPEISPEAIERYQRKLRYKVCYHLGSFCPDVDDIVQETLSRFLRARNEGKIRKPDSTGALLSGICNNVIHEYHRRLWREPPAESGPAFSPRAGTASRSPAVAPEAELIELRDAIGAALAQLSARDREILRGFFLQEKTKAEICESLALTDGQFRVALFRAKDRFRRAYRQDLKRAARQGH